MHNPYVHAISLPKKLTDEEFFLLCQQNDLLDFERDKDGKIIVMSPSGSLSDLKATKILIALSKWNEIKNSPGELFSSSAGFTLPDSSVRSPGVAWVSHEQWKKLTKEQKSKFAPVVPEFIVEVKSPSDLIQDLKEKMGLWIANGVQLGWLIDPDEEKAYTYGADGSKSIFENFNALLHGDQVLPDFQFDLSLLKD